jgi:hypothetical protein
MLIEESRKSLQPACFAFMIFCDSKKSAHSVKTVGVLWFGAAAGEGLSTHPNIAPQSASPYFLLARTAFAHTLISLHRGLRIMLWFK